MPVRVLQVMNNDSTMQYQYTYYYAVYQWREKKIILEEIAYFVAINLLLL